MCRRHTVLGLYVRECVGTSVQAGASIPPKAMTQPSPFPSFPLPPLLLSLPSPFLPFLPLPHSLPFPPIPFPSVRSRTPSNPARGLASPAGSGAELQPKSTLLHFSLKIWHLVTTILNFVPLTSLFLSPEDFCDAFCVAGGAFGRPCVQALVLSGQTDILQTAVDGISSKFWLMI